MRKFSREKGLVDIYESLALYRLLHFLYGCYPHLQFLILHVDTVCSRPFSSMRLVSSTILPDWSVLDWFGFLSYGISEMIDCRPDSPFGKPKQNIPQTKPRLPLENLCDVQLWRREQGWEQIRWLKFVIQKHRNTWYHYKEYWNVFGARTWKVSSSRDLERAQKTELFTWVAPDCHSVSTPIHRFSTFQRFHLLLSSL